MTGIARHLFRLTSPLDGRPQPYLVCAPEPLPAAPPPMIILLHDLLDSPTAEGFIEEAYRMADEWIEPMSQGGPALVLVPFGRGNGGWIGPGGADLVALLDRLPNQFPVDPDAISVCGLGAGGTGALLLAAWFADLFSAVAAIGAWTDANLDLPAGSSAWPEWELAQRSAVSPLSLAENLRHLPVHLEHPWWRTGVGATAAPEHTAHLLDALKELGCPVRFPDADAAADGFRRESPRDRYALFRWLIEQKRRPLPERCSLATYVPRIANASMFRITGRKYATPPARVDCRWDGHVARLKTRGVSELELCLPPGTLVEGIRVDRQDLPALATNDGAVEARTHWDRVGSAWQRLADPDRDHSIDGWSKRPERGGPVMDLFWGPVVLVPGTLGEELDNERMARFAANLRDRWIGGADTLQPYPGNRAVAIDYRIIADTEVTDKERAENSLVLIGNPRTNLLLARFAGRLPIRWETRPGRQARPGGPVGISLNGRWYAEPDDVAFIDCPNPDSTDRYLFIVTVNDTRALARASQTQTAYLPDFFVQRGAKVLDWGYFAADWSVTKPEATASLPD